MPGGSLSPTPLHETSNSPAALLLARDSHRWSPGGDCPQNSPTGKKESSLGGDVKKPGQPTLGWTTLHTASLQLLLFPPGPSTNSFLSLIFSQFLCLVSSPAPPLQSYFPGFPITVSTSGVLGGGGEPGRHKVKPWPWIPVPFP